MCIISVCPKGSQKNTEKVKSFIRSGFECNKDGSGYMFKRDGEDTVTVKKGFFDIEKLLKSIEDLNLKDDDELVVHHRISTGGRVSMENCHPYVISKDHKDCSSTKITTKKPCLVHNGYISKISFYEKLDPDFSDTYAFCRYILSNKFLLDLLDKDDILFTTLTEGMVGTSKIAILFPDKNLSMLGKFIEDEQYFHSNSGYCRPTHNRGGHEYHGHSIESEDYDYESFRNLPALNREINNIEDIYEFQEKREKALQKYMEKKKIKDAVKNAIDSRVLAAEKALEKAINKPEYMRLDSRSVTITMKNCHHFYFIEKSKYKRLENTAQISEYLVEIGAFNISTEFQMANEINNHRMMQSIPTKDLFTDYWYIPKPGFKIAYDQFNDLMFKIQNPGKQTLKKFSRLANKAIRHCKTDTDTIKIKRFNGQNFTKLAILLYKDALEKEIEFQNLSKNKKKNVDNLVTRYTDHIKKNIEDHPMKDILIAMD